MANRTMIATEAIDAAFGHHTAHLEPAEQIAVALAMIQRLADTMEEIFAEHSSASAEPK